MTIHSRSVCLGEVSQPRSMASLGTSRSTLPPPHRLHSHLTGYTPNSSQATLPPSQATLPPPHRLHSHLLTGYTPTSSQATLPPPHRLHSHLLTGYTPTSSQATLPTSSQAILPPPRTICSPLRLVSATTYLKPIPNGPPVGECSEHQERESVLF